MKFLRSCLKIFFYIFGIIFISGQIMAQNMNRVDNIVQRLKAELELTEEQVIRVLEIITESQKQREVEREKYQGDRRAMREAMKSIMHETDVNIESILTEGQKVKFETYRDKRRSERRRHLRGRKGR